MEWLLYDRNLRNERVEITLIYIQKRPTSMVLRPTIKLKGQDAEYIEHFYLFGKHFNGISIYHLMEFPYMSFRMSQIFLRPEAYLYMSSFNVP